MSVITVWPIRLLGIIAALLIIWGSLSYRLGARVPGDFYDVRWNKNPASWQVAPPEMWLDKSAAELEAAPPDLDQAETYVLKALDGENFNGRAFAQLLTIYDLKGNSRQAEEVLELASSYSPARAIARVRIADYWLKQERWDKVIGEWNRLLTRINSGEMRNALFPGLYQLMQTPNSMSIFNSILLQPPKWWDSFYSHLIRQKADISLLNAIYQIRGSSEIPLSTTERRLFVNRLLQEKQWNDANFLWLSGLDERELGLSGLVFDGGFEGKRFNTGFDWNISRSKGLRINTANTTGVKGRRALRVLFNNKTINFRHVSQRLTLPPGNYKLNYRYRLNRLKNAEGLSWRIRCVAGEKRTEPLLNSIALKGRSAWKEVSESFIVPDDCQVQLLRLEASSRFSHKHIFNGSIWFDDFKITRDTEITNNTETTTAEQTQ